MSAEARPLGGRLLTPTFAALVFVFGLAGVLISYRLFMGVGSITALTDGYSWGIWKPINVVTFTGIGAGAYGVGLLTYVLNKGKYHPLVRPAVLVGALGYTLGGSSVMVDLGRWWNSVFLGWLPWYNLNSILLEVAVCVIAYCGVLWVEVMPALLERWQESGGARAKAIAARAIPILRNALPFIIALALLLPTMHQSSLGSLYMMAPTKVHPLWFTGWMPFLFLVSCLSMGYGAVVGMDVLLGAVFRGRYRTHLELLGGLAKVAAGISIFFVVWRFAMLAAEGRLGYAFGAPWIGPSGNAQTFQIPFFWLEIALFVVSGAMYLVPAVRANRGRLFLAAFLGILAGAAYRVNTYLTAYDPGIGWRYFPSVGEIVVTVGLASLGLAGFVLIVKKLPILALGHEGSKH